MLDKNGEELQDVWIKDISCEEKGIVTLLPNTRHKYEDGDEVVFKEIEGMELKEGEKPDMPGLTSLNGEIHKVTVINPTSFYIGDTRKYTEYKRNGIAKQLKVKQVAKFKSMDEIESQN